MLSRLVVNLYAWMIETYLWLILVVSAVAGYYYTVPILKHAGLIPENEIVWKIYGALFFAIGIFLLTALAFGPILVLLDIRKSVRNLERKNGGIGIGIPPAERKEPFL